ncbi:MAG: hypothetical protein JXR22_00125 [Prolixibacteraceae bacterium]|nr:hypothetical protein [Prolixibacteraceae bacterium]
MNTFKQIFRFSFWALPALLLTSCLKDASNEQTAYGDVFVKAVQLTDSTVGYQLQMYAYSWSEMKNVAVLAQKDSTVYELDTIDYKYTFAWRPLENNYLPQAPAEDKYFFEITFEDGEEQVVTDYLSASMILPPKIKALNWNDENKSIEVEWEPVANAHLYSVTLISASGQIVYETELLDRTVNLYHINQFSYGWYNNRKPTETSTYQVVVNAFLFEPIASTFDIQCMALNNLGRVTWVID